VALSTPWGSSAEVRLPYGLTLTAKGGKPGFHAEKRKPKKVLRYLEITQVGKNGKQISGSSSV